jgi:hypothetical protein
MTAAQYDEIIRRLEAAGAGAPEGRLYHASYGDTDQVAILRGRGLGPRESYQGCRPLWSLRPGMCSIKMLAVMPKSGYSPTCGKQQSKERWVGPFSSLANNLLISGS